MALSLLLVVGVAAVLLFVNYRELNARTEEARQATAAYSKALAETEASRSALTALEAERETLKQNATSANPVDQARLDELAKEIEAARTQAKGSQDELTKLRNSQKQTDSDRSGLLSRIDALQKERDDLRQQLNAYNVQQTPQQKATPSTANDERVATLQKQLDDERKTSASRAEEITRLRDENGALRSKASASPATLPSASTPQDVTQAFAEGVRAYELKNFTAAISSLRRTLAIEEVLTQEQKLRLPKDVRLSGTRFVPYVPASYLAAALHENKSDCLAIRLALRDATVEAVPSNLTGRLDAARRACPN